MKMSKRNISHGQFVHYSTILGLITLMYMALLSFSYYRFMEASDGTPTTRRSLLVGPHSSQSNQLREAKSESPGLKQERKEAEKDTDASSMGWKRHHPLTSMVRSFPMGPQHDPTQRRSCFALTAVPDEINTLVSTVKKILSHELYTTFDCVHVSVPDRPLRYSFAAKTETQKDTMYPTTSELKKMFFNHSRVVLHRLFDHGPLTRYLGPLAYEQHPDTSMVIFDMDTNSQKIYHRSLYHLVQAAQDLDNDAMWCYQGENFLYDEDKKTVRPNWDLFPAVPVNDTTGRSWNYAHFCRGVSGMLFKPKHFNDFFWNQSDYSEGCFWDDDRWVSYQMERQEIPIKVLHLKNEPEKRIHAASPQAVIKMKKQLDGLQDNAKNKSQVQGSQRIEEEGFPRRRLGSLTAITNRLQSATVCPIAWLTKHPETYPSARVKTPIDRVKQPKMISQDHKIKQTKHESEIAKLRQQSLKIPVKSLV